MTNLARFSITKPRYLGLFIFTETGDISTVTKFSS